MERDSDKSRCSEVSLVVFRCFWKKQVSRILYINKKEECLAIFVFDKAETLSFPEK